jgi:hypothetical protein
MRWTDLFVNIGIGSRDGRIGTIDLASQPNE